jgi:hypothetical protein
MKLSLAICTAASSLVAATSLATAQEASPQPPSTVTVVAVPTCRLSEHQGIDDPSAATAARLVCAAIARTDDTSGSRYRVSLGTLGSVVVLSVAREGSELGSTVDSREMLLHDLEEVIVAAPRIAASIVHGTPIVETQTVENLVSQETREPATKPGKLHFAIGLLGTFSPYNQGFGAAPGGLLDLHYELPQWELSGSLRFGGGSSSNTLPTNSFFDFSLGGRYFFDSRDVSAYFGGGLAWSYYSLHVPNIGFDGNNSGFGLYVDGGVEVMRTRHSHLALGLRVDVPFYALNNQSDGLTQTMINGVVVPQTSAPSTYYFLPISLEARLTF